MANVNASSPRNSSATPNTTANGIDPIDYDTEEPFVSFERARQSGDFRVFACATVLEPLTLWAELLTVAVIAAPVFDKLFSEMVAINEEGAAISTEAGRPTTGIPFTADARQRLRTSPCHRSPGPASSWPGNTETNCSADALLVTGAAGFVGYAVASLLVEHGHTVTGLTAHPDVEIDFWDRRTQYDMLRRRRDIVLEFRWARSVRSPLLRGHRTHALQGHRATRPPNRTPTS